MTTQTPRERALEYAFRLADHQMVEITPDLILESARKFEEYLDYSENFAEIEYTAPELELSEEALKRIEKMVENAVKKGSFPDRIGK